MPASARVIATVRSETDEAVARRAGADEVARSDSLSDAELIAQVLGLSAGGVDHIVEVAFDANNAVDAQLLAIGGSIGTYATGRTAPSIPFWDLVFKNIRVHFLGSDDFPAVAKAEAAEGINTLLGSDWPGFTIDRRFRLVQIAQAHDLVEAGRPTGRVVVLPGG